MEFALSYMLWGLLALAIPLLIHLIGNRKLPARPIGSVVLFKGNLPRKRSALKLHRKTLLVVRSLLILLLTMLLAAPYLPQHKNGDSITEKVILVTSNLNYNHNKLLFDSLQQLGYSLYQARTGLPLLGREASGFPDFFEALREASAKESWADTIWILGNPYWHNLKGELPKVSKLFIAFPTTKTLNYQRTGGIPTVIEAHNSYNIAKPSDTVIWNFLLHQTATLTGIQVNVRSWEAKEDNTKIHLQLSDSTSILFKHSESAINNFSEWFLPTEPNTYVYSWNSDSILNKPHLADRLLADWVEISSFHNLNKATISHYNDWQPIRVKTQLKKADSLLAEGYRVNPLWYLLIFVLLFLERWWSLSLAK